MATKTGQRRTAITLSILVSLVLVFILSVASVFAASSEPEGPGKEDPGTKLKLYEGAKKAAEDIIEESSDYSSAYDSGTGVHQDPTVFEKNFDLTPAQKKTTIKTIEDGVSTYLDDDMSDLEKYYMLALWENYSVKYDSEFWPGGYDFDYYSHQWDAYGVFEEHKGVCAGIAVTYAVICHAADLPCKFVRCDKYLDHTISWIPDINGHSYYIDVTENGFFMSADSDWSFEPIDLKFSGIDEEDRPADGSFEYATKKGDESRVPANITDFYSGKTGEGEFKPIAFEKWFNEYALHQNTKKYFFAKYEEKGSGNGTKHAAYKDYAKQPYASRTGDTTNIWFLDDFYKEPATIKEKIENKELDEQLLIIDAIEENYDCDTEGKSEEQVAEALKDAITADISPIDYFPSFNGSKVVPEAAQLIKDTDYELSVQYDDTEHKATVTITGKGDYKGDCQFTVTVNTAQVTKAPIRDTDIEYDGDSHRLLSDPGQAANGTMVYAIGTRDKPTGEFSANIPTATNAGAYYIWYKAAGDDKHFDSEPERIVQPVMIEPISTMIICDDERTIRVGETIKLSAELDPEMEATFYFESGDEDIATVSADGTVTGVAPGSTTITITAKLKSNDPNYAEPYDGMVEITVISATYRNVSGDGNVWYRGSKYTSDFVFERMEDEASTFDHFTGILVDGEIVDEENYTKESGSVIIKLKPSYLSTLALGKHTLKAEFNDGSASAEFTVAEKSDSGTRTGDDTNLLLWIALMTASLIGIVLGMMLKRRGTE